MAAFRVDPIAYVRGGRAEVVDDDWASELMAEHWWK